MNSLKDIVTKINSLVEEIKIYKDYKKRLLTDLDSLEAKKNKISKQLYETKLKKILQGRTKENWIGYYNSYISNLLTQIENNLDLIISSLGITDKKKVIQVSEKFTLDKKTKDKYLSELGIGAEYVKTFIMEKRGKKKEKGKVEIPIYSVYKINKYAEIANSFFGNLSTKLVASYPEFFKKLFQDLRSSNIKILSKSYVSVILFSTVLALIAGFILSFLLLAITSGNILVSLIRAIFISIFLGAMTFAGLYMYPTTTLSARKRAIKNDLPFVIIHMSAVAGSGAQPTAIFDLILSSEEYKGIEGEIKKIVNYVNLFGYDLSTALRAVALTTPSKDLSELLNGLVSTVQTGGDLSQYLRGKAEDTMVNYSLERKKYVETLSTYSDVYTGILIAAPLLFFVTLAIIQMIGGSIAGLEISTLAMLGVFIGIPVLNIAFILFMNIVQPEA